MRTQNEEATPSGHYLSILGRRRWLLALTMVAAWAAAMGFGFLATAKYRSETLVLIEQANVPAQFATPTVSIDLQQRLRTLTEQILSRTQLARIAEENHLYGVQAGQTIPESAVNQMRADINVELIKPAGQSDVSAFKIAYLAPNALLAQKVTGQLAALFIQDSLRDQQHLSEETAQFLDSELSAARAELERQDNLQNEFKRKYSGELPEQGGPQNVATLQTRLGTATAALHAAEQQKVYFASVLGTARPTVESAPQVPVTPQDEQIAKMKEDLATLSTQYTQRHPDVVRLKEQIANAERAKRQAVNNPGVATAQSEGMRADRTISQRTLLEGQAKANELELANRQQEVQDLERQIAAARSRTGATPLRQHEFAEMNRNRQQAKANYESLLAKKQQSGMAADMEQRRQGEQFRMIDPPSLPQKPYSPNRLRFAGIGLLLGFFLGLGMIAVMETVDARIQSEDDLRHWVKAPVIGTVPPLPTEAEKQNHARRRGLEIAFGAVLIALVPALTFVAYLKG